MFYKNILFVQVTFWYGAVSAYSANNIYEKWLYQCYNLFFTALPIMWFSIMDFEYEKEKLFREPKYYIIGLQNLHF